MKRIAAVLTGIILLVACTACNNFFHELIPPDDNRISEFKLEGQTENADINNNDNIINIPWNEEMGLAGKRLISRVSVPFKASLLPLTKEYLQEAFPSIKNFDDIINMIEGATEDNLTSSVTELIKKNKDFTVPALDKPIDFSRPVTLLVISGHGSVRRYTVNIVIYVIFESNGGSSVETINAAYGETIEKPADPVKTGCVFGGWYRDNNTFAQPWNFSTNTVTGKITLYAQWDPITYTVRYEKNASDATGTMVDSIHTYDVEKALNANGFTRGDYTFAAWNTAPGGSGIGYSDSQIVKNLSSQAGDVIVLYARWNGINQNTVSFNSNGGSNVSPIIGVNNGEKISKPSDPTKTGSTFGGWYKDNNTFTQPWNFNSDTVTGNITLYARWEAFTYKVRYEKNASGVTGNTPDSTHIYNVEQALNANGYTRDEYIFTSWNTEKNGSGTAYGDGQNVKNLSSQAGAVVTLYAQWKKLEVNSIVVIFNSNGGSNVSPITGLKNGDKISKPANPTKSGSTFLGWYKESALNSEWNFSTDIVTGNITLYAKWKVSEVPGPGTEPGTGPGTGPGTEPGTGPGTGPGTEPEPGPGPGTVPVTYTVTFNSNGGSAVPNQTVSSGEKITRPADPTKPDYTFLGWLRDNLHTWNFDSENVTGNITLTAGWKKN